MHLTTADVAKYIGGQMEVQNQQERYLFRGEIKEIKVTDDNNLEVTFSWLAQAIGYPLPLKRWVLNERKTYTASLEIYSASDIGNGRLSLNSYITRELVVLFPPDGSKLDPAKVEGLVIPPK